MPDLLDTLKDAVRGDQFSDMTILLERAGHPELAKFWRKFRADAVAAIAEVEDAKPDLLAALKAVKARVDGVFDAPELMAFGPLSTDTAADCLAIAIAAIAEAEGR